MPQHKVAKAIKEIARLREQVREDAVLEDGSILISAILSGDVEAAIQELAGQMKVFQIRHDDKVLQSAKAGEELGKGLMEHI
ncbi:hypothetical protein LCGC14_1268450 [marine sediment metagenome]|uniref:Uncharacterized protein n=1 Tax=marine sediment metagenome TaxID=412755 RepID=A0A0F9L0L8_9ZZZZ|nr:hypothetical protein [Desulfobacterales bacterium]